MIGDGVEIDRDVDGCKRRLGGSKGALKFGEWGWFYRAMKRGRDWVYGLIWVLRLSD